MKHFKCCISQLFFQACGRWRSSIVKYIVLVTCCASREFVAYFCGPLVALAVDAHVAVGPHVTVDPDVTVDPTLLLTPVKLSLVLNMASNDTNCRSFDIYNIEGVFDIILKDVLASIPGIPVFS